MKKSPIKIKTHRDCEYSGCRKNFKKQRSTDKYCSPECKIADKGYPESKPQKPIPKQSTKRKKENQEYFQLTLKFLSKPENKICPVTGNSTTEVHHKMGRIGYADEWARLHGIPLLIDVRYFLGVSRNGHRWIEEHPVEAKEKGWSVSRLEKKD